MFSKILDWLDGPFEWIGGIWCRLFHNDVHRFRRYVFSPDSKGQTVFEVSDCECAICYRRWEETR